MTADKGKKEVPATGSWWPTWSQQQSPKQQQSAGSTRNVRLFSNGTEGRGATVESPTRAVSHDFVNKLATHPVGVVSSSIVLFTVGYAIPVVGGLWCAACLMSGGNAAIRMRAPDTSHMNAKTAALIALAVFTLPVPLVGGSVWLAAMASCVAYPLYSMGKSTRDSVASMASFAYRGAGATTS